MAISIYKIKKWYDMLVGNSVHHVNQDEGKYYLKDNVSGYYNNLTEKVSRFGAKDASVPKSFVDTGEEIYFSIEIFQYGLAAYDLYLASEKKDKSMLEKVIACANWGVDNQLEDGSWITFAYETPDYPFSAMAQGEGVSLLIRAFNETKDERYVVCLKKAMKFMLTHLRMADLHYIIIMVCFFMNVQRILLSLTDGYSLSGACGTIARLLKTMRMSKIF